MGPDLLRPVRMPELPRKLPNPDMTTETPNASIQAIRGQAVTTSHNTFRPDIYRVSEGYLN